MRPLKVMPPYISEADLANELLGDRAKEWRALAKKLERDAGFPTIDTVFGRRYWPAVRVWLDRRYGIPIGNDDEDEWRPSSKRRGRGFGKRNV
jgi:hypothetical protein